MSENQVIGNRDRLPWRIPEDLAWFHSVTEGQTSVVGRKTLESMPIRPQNTYLVLTRNEAYVPTASNIKVIHTLEEIPKAAPDGQPIWICGGSAVYRATLEMCQYLYLTTVKAVYEGDAYFPEFSDTFTVDKIIKETDKIRIARYKNKQV